MTHSPQSENDPDSIQPSPDSPNPPPEPPRRRSPRRWWRRVGLGVGAVLLVGGSLGTWRAWIFVTEDLAPEVERSLARTLNRPVELGELESFSLRQLRFGPSAVPPTATDQDQLTIDAVEVSFNLLQGLWQRRIGLNVRLIEPNVFLDQTEDGRWIQIEPQTRESTGFIKTELDTIVIEEGRVVLAPFPRSLAAEPEAAEPEAAASDEATSTDITPSGAAPLTVTLENVNGNATFQNNNQDIAFEAVTDLASGGSAELAGDVQVESRDIKLSVQGQNVSGPTVLALIPLPLQLQAGRLWGNLEIELQGTELQSITGTARFAEAIAVIRGVPNQFRQANGRLRFLGRQIALEDVEAVYGEIPATASGSIDLDEGYALTAQVRSLDPNRLFQTFDLPVPVEVSGAFDADLALTGALDEPLLTGTARNTRTVQVDRVNLESVSTGFAVTPEGLTFEEIAAVPVGGGQVRGNGRITFAEPGQLSFRFTGRDLPGDTVARSYGLNNPNLRIGAVAADAQIVGTFQAFQTAIQWQTPSSTYPGRGTILIARDQIQLRDTVFQVAGGTVSARADSQAGRWQAVVDAAGVQLNTFAANLTGAASGSFQLSGTLDNLNPRGIRAAGDVQLSEGLPGLNRPLTAALQWTGDGIRIEQASGPGVSASGFIATRLEGPGAPAIANLDLAVQVQDYNLAEAPVTLPSQVAVAGLADFTGEVTGTLEDLQVAGTLGLDSLRVNDLAFESRLTGPIAYGSQRGLDLDLRGASDRLAVQLDAQNRPVAFTLRQDQITATGTQQGDYLVAEVRNFPLEALNIAPAAQQGLGEVGGLLNGNFSLNLQNLSNPEIIGAVAIANPSLGYIRGNLTDSIDDRFTGRFRYANGVLDLSEGELVLGNSQYSVTGVAAVQGEPTFQGQVVIEQGDVQDILTALQFFELDDFGRGLETPAYNAAADLDLVPVDVTQLSLLDQLRRYSELATLLEQQRQQEAQEQILPELADLDGTFSGTIDLALAPDTGFTADFEITGQDWTWTDQYAVEEVVANGSLSEGVLTLFPVRLQTGDRFLAFSGQVGGDQQSGLLRVQNVPVEPIQDLVDLPLALEGDLNATATLAGSLQNPQVIGELGLINGELNDTPVQEAQATFGYTNARLDFDGRVVVNAPEPLTISGSVPYALTFMDTNPEQPGINLLPEINLTDDIRLDIDVRNEGLALLNILTQRQLLWEGGMGTVDVVVDGTLNRPVAVGNISLSGATLSAQVLPEPITDVTGEIEFNTNLIQVMDLQGQFSRGQVFAQGNLPIRPNGASGNPDEVLTVRLQRLLLEYPSPTGQELYDGKVDGRVLITGGAIAPVLGGRLILSDGRVFLPDGSQTVVTPGAGGETAADESLFSPPRLNNLVVRLGENLLVTRVPVLNFVVSGDLTVSGTFDDLRPEGRVNLLSGQVNLFTTQFNLARGYDSYADFNPEDGLTPYVDVQLVTSVLDATRTRFESASPFAQSEIADRPVTDFGSLQTIRVEASVQGPADEIFDNLELTSSPRRSENEIIALLGGGFVDTLGQGNGVLAIANLAGSALLTNVQTFVGNALGLSEFRLFPTTISSSEDNTSSFGIAAELGVDITQDVSVSALQVLTDDSVPTQFNLRYRLNDEFLLRGSTNLSGDNRLVLEFETRF